MNRYPSPLRYPGGKSCIYPFFSRLLEENDLIGISYAEPFAGGCGLGLRLLFDEYVKQIFLNDLDPAIYHFWNGVLAFPDEFCSWISAVEISVETWRKSKHIYLNQPQFPPFEIAKATFFLNRTNVSGVIATGGIIGGYSQNGTYKIDARFKRPDLISKIEKIALFRDRIVLSNLDGAKFVKQIENRKSDTLLYLDPPYVAKGADLYMNFFVSQDHRRLARLVKNLRSKWVVSYDSNDFIYGLFKDFRMVNYQLSQNASNRVGDELLVFESSLEFGSAQKLLTNPRILGFGEDSSS